jgi:hypothetical protein
MHFVPFHFGLLLELRGGGCVVGLRKRGLLCRKRLFCHLQKGICLFFRPNIEGVLWYNIPNERVNSNVRRKRKKKEASFCGKRAGELVFQSCIFLFNLYNRRVFVEQRKRIYFT